MHRPNYNRDQICTLLGHYAAKSGNSLPSFRDSISVPETSVRNCYYPLHNIPEERRSHLLRSGSLKLRKLVFFMAMMETQSVSETQADFNHQTQLKARDLNQFISINYPLSHLPLALPCATFCSGFRNKIVYGFIDSPMCATFLSCQREQAHTKYNNVFSSLISDMFVPNMVIIRLPTGKTRQMYTELYWDSNLSALHTLLYKETNTQQKWKTLGIKIVKKYTFQEFNKKTGEEHTVILVTSVKIQRM